ncbi:SIMPL domain-containing protein [Alkalihalobacterium alkalinitrilicum]|uniref:SIMPL domain-containing protein n=1 Tax=Alkalihalobacterium alkalinitrilicum TaxID=427920 RepID=UPI000995C468|nr:SIMPL domain-containing protein [Alkalihalobacterium alkalinitrilicum]
MYFQQNRNSLEANRNRLTVVGEGEVAATPDIIQITLGIRTEGESANETIQTNARIANQIIENLENSGIPQDRIETKSYNVRPMYDYIDGKSILRGYEVEHLFEVTMTDVNQVGEVLSASAKAGANVMHGLQFKISNPLEYYLQALAIAIQSGTQKANHISEQIGVTLDYPPLSITEISDQPISVFQPEGKVLSTAFAATPPITTQDVLIQAKVTMVYSYN